MPLVVHVRGHSRNYGFSDHNLATKENQKNSCNDLCLRDDFGNCLVWHFHKNVRFVVLAGKTSHSPRSHSLGLVAAFHSCLFRLGFLSLRHHLIIHDELSPKKPS